MFVDNPLVLTFAIGLLGTIASAISLRINTERGARAGIVVSFLALILSCYCLAAAVVPLSGR